MGLKVSGKGLEKPDINIKELDATSFEIKFRVSAPGSYSLTVNWGDDNPIPGSPFALEIS
eukprot:NODE_4254_length_326_cov_58.805054_g4172_i0.p2 GENE.NODE_4254_length_326_cov_58.805054_g4172_i0~~NODE_4254_length_326_cov_58.805054_g4172_i0.p2  ORF type:complete len:60 (-),score=10.40 NODE_4254_length_326_cov_58.805054_g4172_i0:118-297(-)